MDVFILLGLLLLLFVVAVFWLGSKNKRGHSVPKRKNVSPKGGYRGQVFWPGSKDNKREHSAPKQKVIFPGGGHRRQVFWNWGNVNKERRGVAGERVVAEILRSLPIYEYRVFNDVLLYNPFGGTSQIDHIVVSQFGVFVIETKNIGGKVYGGENAMYWKKYIKGQEYKFYNPVRQNNTHIAVLAENLASFDVPFISVVVFSPDAELRVNVNNGTEVLCWNGLLEMLRRYEYERISRSKAEAFGVELNRVRIKGIRSYQRHAEEVRAYVQETEMAIQDGICPFCGGKLVRRKGKFGDFFGCSTYPDCNFMQKID